MTIQANSSDPGRFDQPAKTQTDRDVGAPSGQQWQRAFVVAVAVFLCIRLAVILTAQFGVSGKDINWREGSWWSDIGMIRWDSAFYNEIMREGYRVEEPPPTTVAFFPAYPLLTRPLADFVHPHTALLVVANLAAIFGALFLFAWARKAAGARAAVWSVVFAGAYPPAIFLSAGYAESLFFLEAAAALYLLSCHRVVPAAVLSGLATATRPTGVALCIVVVVWYARSVRSEPVVRRLFKITGIGLISVSGLVAYQAYLWGHYGRADAFFAIQSHWPPASYRPWYKTVTMWKVFDSCGQPLAAILQGEWHRLLGPWTWSTLLGVCMVALSAKGLVRPEGVPRELYIIPVVVFFMAYLRDPVGGSLLRPLGRYQTVALPSFLLLGMWASRTRHRFVPCALAVAAGGFQCVYAWAFANWFWVG